MELPRRMDGDQYTPPGRYREVQEQLLAAVSRHDIPILYVYAFDYRTRVGPFLFLDRMLVPAGPIAIGAALHAAGLRNVRLVLQQWTPNVRPSRALLQGRRPELLLISGMQIHSAAAYELIRDAWKLGDQRPLILAGGAKAIYQPWDFFALSADGRVGADAVITGEEFVLLELLERILNHRSSHESMLSGFRRVRQESLLEDIPGLVYRPDDGPGRPEYLVHTGIQRLVQNLDELPLPHSALGLFEPPHRQSSLAPRPWPAGQLNRQGKILSIVTTHGCKFRCSYCPIPAYNQFTFRHKSPERLIDELISTVKLTGIRRFFGTDDNFFNDRGAVEEIFTAMARSRIDGQPFGKALNFATEATEFDVYKQRDLIPLAREAGLRLIWFGIEDLTAQLVKKGQNSNKTQELFQLLLAHDIAPMPMLMHHDGQPLWQRNGLYGLLNQVRFLRRAGALSVQVTFLTPSVGSKGYEQPYKNGIVFKRVGNRVVDDSLYDGNHCIASRATRPWQKQLNMLASYAYFYNPVNWARAALTFDRLWKYRMMFQAMGNASVVWSLFKESRWLWQLTRGSIEQHDSAPDCPFPLVTPQVTAIIPFATL